MKHFGDFFQNENDGKSNWRVDSDVVDLSLASGPGTVNLEQPIRVVLRHKKVCLMSICCCEQSYVWSSLYIMLHSTLQSC